MSVVVVALLVFGALCYLGLTAFAFAFSGKSELANKVSRYVFLPAIVINKTNFITANEIKSNLNSIERFYENQDFAKLGLRVDFSTADGKKRLKIRERELINKMIEDRAVEILAKERGIKVTKQMLDASVDRRIGEYGGGKAIKENLQKLYGWSLNDFKRKVVRPSLYREKLNDWLDENDGAEERKQSKARAEKARQAIAQGESFEDVANEVNNTKNGGRLGWFKEEFLIKELRPVVLRLKKGEASKVIETPLGFHIVKLNDTKEEDGEKLYDLSQIFFPKLTLAEWLTDKIAKMKVSVLLKEYQWNAKSGMVEFKSEEMRKFEQKELTNEQRDASLLAI